MLKLLVTSATALVIAACGLPFGLGRPSNAELENGAADNLAKATSFEAKGAFTEGATTYQFDVMHVAPATEDVQVTQGALTYEELQINGRFYYRGSQYLTSVIGNILVRGVGTRWFASNEITPIDLSPFIDANKVKAFLNSGAGQRTDDVIVDGQGTAELTLSVGIVNITENSPYRVLRLRSVKGTTVGGVSGFDVMFTNYNKDFGIQAPTNAFDYDDPTTWPPLYHVDSVSQVAIPGTNSCNDPCVLMAVVENMGGVNGASASSTITFALTASDQSPLGSCKATIQPDRPHGQKFTVSCTVQSSAWTNYSGNYSYRATADNPAYD